jgi:hypothetical protein
VTRRPNGTARLDREWTAFQSLGAATGRTLLYLLHVSVLGARNVLGLSSVGRHAAGHGRRHAVRRVVGLPEIVTHYLAAALTWTVHDEDHNDRSALSRLSRIAINSVLALGTLGALWLVNR